MARGAPTGPRSFGWCNARGLWTLVFRDIRRYWKDGVESLGGPAVSALLFLAVFVLALGGHGEAGGGLTFAQFVTPGIAMFTLMHSGFSYGAVPIVYDKYEGMISDVLSAPLTGLEVALGYTLSATANALVTGGFVLAVMSLFVGLPAGQIATTIAFAVTGAVLFGLIGVLVGLWAERWDHYSAAETFLVLPLGVLSGAFFPLDALPEPGSLLILLNPAFHAIDGVRYGLTGYTAWAPWASLPILMVVDLLLGLVAWRLFAIGYRIKA